jgi:hypothetical protein
MPLPHADQASALHAVDTGHERSRPIIKSLYARAMDDDCLVDGDGAGATYSRCSGYMTASKSSTYDVYPPPRAVSSIAMASTALIR